MEYSITPVEYEKICKLVYSESGISLGASKQSLVVSRLTKRLRDLQLDSFDKYYDFVMSDSTRDEFTRMLDLISTNKTVSKENSSPTTNSSSSTGCSGLG